MTPVCRLPNEYAKGVCDRPYISVTEVMKGPCGSVGMTFRHVPASEGDAVHVSIETPPLASTCDLDLSVQDSKLVEGRLKVTLIECSRLFILGSYDRETYIHCTLELSSHQWKEKTRSSIKQVRVFSHLHPLLLSVFSDGYGEIYPITLPGKVACVLYAMVGIPLMLLVILDVGDFLALVMSRAYVHIHSLFKALRSRSWSPWKRGGKAADSGRFVLSQDVVIREPLDLRQVLRSQADVRHKSVHLENNREIFEKILARENLKRKGPLLKSLSCPELDQLLPAPKGYAIWDFSGLGDGMETLDFPFILILLIVFAYICLGGLILPLWETEFEDFDPYYFCFITLTTIGFGDIVPRHPNYFMLTSLFIIVGMAIMSMAFKLSQTRIVGCYRKCIKFISRGNAETSKDEADV
ncbi:unnamed protein product [Menidia menidia]|uniref:(Atlantic silverside) hypothetical protein n=1 Tax=Menidia menidia TaxID=238744 RepID=A0A8S4C205_9TELE|nr:unnamed protein product [Menidia menidia]